jgi:hypothetical protein
LTNGSLVKPPLDLDAIFPELALIRDPSLRAGTEAVWQDLWQRSPFEAIEDLPSSPEIPYPHVPHNRAVIALALAVAETFERFHGVVVDRDILVSPGLLQDVSKLVEYRPGVDGACLTELGAGYPHAFLAAHAALVHGLPDAVCQIIVTHTPHSSTFPSSIEGKILYYVDQLDVIAIHKDRWRKELFITK